MMHLLAAALVSSTLAAADAPKIRTLIVTGHNNHNWQFTSRVHKETLEATGRFEVLIADDLAAWVAKPTPENSIPLGLIVLDYNDMQAPKRWGDKAEAWFTATVHGGTGVVAIHSANNAFKGWAKYESMIGLMWRDGAGHGDFHEFTVNLTDHEHPITKGLADFTTSDELYHKLSNPQNSKYTLLAQAMDDKAFKGTGENEPMAITLTYDKGRIFATPLGHVWTNTGEATPGGQAQKLSILNNGFRTLLVRGAEWAATGQVTLPATWTEPTPPLPAEKDGWVNLFDGKTSAHWKGFKQDKFPDKGWRIENGMLIHAAGGGGGDICTVDEYDNFEFECQWRISEGGNSGIMYRCDEKHDWPWATGREMQILDDARHQDGKKAKTRAGTMYDIYACDVDVVRPAGYWNTARVVCNGTKIEHWLNGFKVVSTDTAGDDYAKALAESKFPKMNLDDFGKLSKGKIALQDHGDEVAFRNIRIKVIK